MLFIICIKAEMFILINKTEQIFFLSFILLNVDVPVITITITRGSNSNNSVTLV